MPTRSESILAITYDAIDLGTTHAVDCRSIFLTDNATSHPRESSEEIIGESDRRFNGNASLFVKDSFAGGDKIMDEVLGRGEIECE